MADWKKYYEEHMMSTEEVVKLINSGDRIWVGNTCNVPFVQLDALADRYEELDNVTVLSNMFANPLKMLADPKYGKAFHHISYFPNAQERRAFSLGLLDYASIPYGYIKSSIDDTYKTNVIMVETCEPDEDGYVNIGLWGPFLTAQVLKGKNVEKISAVVNKYHTPATGDPDYMRIPVEKIAAFCRSDHPLLALGESAPEEIDRVIASQIMQFVRDGDTVQVGKGGLGNAIGFDLNTKKDIDIYSEILSDWIVDLSNQGVIRNVVAGGCFGTQPLYDFANNAKNVTFKTIPCLATPDAVAEMDNFVAINTCMMADLTGQACSEGSGAWQYSAVGGQLEFVKGANKIRLNGGRAYNILALRSTRTDKDGKVYSNIVTEFPPASAVTTPRGEAMYYATEFGVVDLWGKALNERVVAMISIAHPDFREELKARAIELKLAKPQDF